MSSGDEKHSAMCKGKHLESPSTKEAREQLEKKVSQQQVLVGPYGEKTRLVKLINGGSFGQIFLGENTNTAENVAVKVEHPGQVEQLLYEGQVYRKLAGGPGIPAVSWYGMHGSMFNVLVMDLLGPSLQDLFQEASYKFSLKTVLLLADQMLDTLQFVHDRDFVHRDLSSNNFMMGRGSNSHKLYLVDFGLAKRFNASPGWNTMKRTMFRFARPMVGTARFCSIFCHRGEEESRRDDMESLGYLLLYLLRGRLPWQGVHAASSTEKIDTILSLKISTPLSELCGGLPEEFLTYMTFVRGMAQYDVPNYNAIKQLFRELAKKEGIEYDFSYDWSSVSNGVAGLASSEEHPVTASSDAGGDFLHANRTISTCSSSPPSDGIPSH